MIKTPQHVPLSTAGSVGVSLVLAAGLIFQPIRWGHTPAYGNLLDITSTQWWGLGYFIVAVSLILGITFIEYRVIALSAHVLAFVLLVAWEAAFFVRWVTDPYTTVANVVAWLVYLSMIIVSARQVDDHTRLIKSA
jgi:hypothetical protein